MSRKKSYFVWTEEKKYVLAQLALKYKGYKNSDRTHAEKLKLKVGFEEEIEIEIELKLKYQACSAP